MPKGEGSGEGVDDTLVSNTVTHSRTFILPRFSQRLGYEDKFPLNFVYYESINRELKIRPIYECRCDERLQTKVKEFTRLSYTGLIGGLEHLKIMRDEVNKREDCECVM